jgi:hypothetical protein
MWVETRPSEGPPRGGDWTHRLERLAEGQGELGGGQLVGRRAVERPGEGVGEGVGGEAGAVRAAVAVEHTVHGRGRGGGRPRQGGRVLVDADRVLHRLPHALTAQRGVSRCGLRAFYGSRMESFLVKHLPGPRSVPRRQRRECPHSPCSDDRAGYCRGHGRWSPSTNSPTARRGAEASRRSPTGHLRDRDEGHGDSHAHSQAVGPRVNAHARDQALS